ncbi:alpha-ketoglutarate-dependent dioxygenase AlkB [Shinella sp.]|uniref:alpha-ketoglutarate-dependent dioxygenase AlkB n=1 Tax=Shinella sp. TaxID=1870904 RepID=UPI003D29FD86
MRRPCLRVPHTFPNSFPERRRQSKIRSTPENGAMRLSAACCILAISMTIERAVLADAYLGKLPPWLETFAERLVTRGYFVDLPDQVIANEYLPGQGISAHVDCAPCFDDTIISISLLSQCEMNFRERSSSRSLAVLLHPHSGILLKGVSQYDWTHEIPARKSDVVDDTKVNRGRRISLTFRKVIQATGKPL